MYIGGSYSYYKCNITEEHSYMLSINLKIILCISEALEDIRECIK